MLRNIFLQGNKMTLNCHGAWLPINSIATCGGLIRNEEGEFMGGFACNLGNNSIL